MTASDRMVLGRQVDHSRTYDPRQLCPIPRKTGRAAAGIGKPSFSHGVDIWNMYELSWLEDSGKPRVAMAEIRVPWDSPCLIESKSLKLYCNSFNMTPFSDSSSVQGIMADDLSHAAGAPVRVRLVPPEAFRLELLSEPEGICLDDQDVRGFVYETDSALLSAEAEAVRETLFTRLFRSRCPVTGQPDWATVHVSYEGPRIRRDALLRYLVSYREHQGFHEACVEKIHADITQRCGARELEVGARFTRRGGLDINPVRSTRPGDWPNLRDPRQ